MVRFVLNIQRPVSMRMTGKFTSPSQEWMHMNRILMDYELFVQTRGTLYIADEQQRYVLKEGDYLLMPPRTKQFGYETSDCSFYWLHFLQWNDEGDSRTIDPDSNSHEPDTISIPSTGTLRYPDKLIVMMKQLQDSVRSYREPMLINYMATTILCELSNQVSRKTDIPERKLKQLQLYNDIVDYIQWHRFDSLKVSDIAEHFGYNAKYLSHLFSTISGMPLKQYLIHQKIEAASFLLTDTNQTINEIALQLNYHDSHHFMKSFKQVTGLTPTEFRNAYANRLLFYE